MNWQPIAIAIVEHGGQFLVGPRPEGVPLAGYWEFPGGKVKPGETASAAAVRECLEETGLHVEVGCEYPAQIHPYEHGEVELRFFACRLSHDRAGLAPTAPFRWVHRSKLQELRFPEGNRSILRFLLANDEP